MDDLMDPIEDCGRFTKYTTFGDETVWVCNDCDTRDDNNEGHYVDPHEDVCTACNEATEFEANYFAHAVYA